MSKWIPALVGAIRSGGIAKSGLLKYGQKALDPVLEQLHNPDPLMRSGALSFGVTLLLKESDAAARVRIGGLIQSGLQDHECVVRRAAVRSIERLDDRKSYVPTLVDLSEQDLVNIPESGMADGYPVRQEANRVLCMIANHEWPHQDARVSGGQVSPH